MLISRKVLLLFTATAAVSCADVFSITLINPVFPGGAIAGGNAVYGIQDLTLTNTSGSNWFVKVHTNYGTTLPGASEVIPDYNDGIHLSGQTGDFLGDLLIEQKNVFYGIVFHAHDGFDAGDVYKSDSVYNAVGSGWRFWQSIYGLSSPPPVALMKGGESEVGTFTGVGVAATTQKHGPKDCNGTDCALYEITDTFSISSSFFDPSQAFMIDMSSSLCANGLIADDAPEPSSLPIVSALLLGVSVCIRRRMKVSRSTLC
jgi:hypothetical protein